MTETELRGCYRDLARWCGYSLQYHTHDSRRSDFGWPDDVLLRPGDKRLLIVEAKNATRKPTDAQSAWLDALDGAVVETHLWRPADWLDGTIERQLRGGEGDE